MVVVNYWEFAWLDLQYQYLPRIFYSPCDNEDKVGNWIQLEKKFLQYLAAFYCVAGERNTYRFTYLIFPLSKKKWL